MFLTDNFQNLLVNKQFLQLDHAQQNQQIRTAFQQLYLLEFVENAHQKWFVL